MQAMSSNRIEIIDKFFEKFANAAIQTLHSVLDKDAYQKLELTVESYQESFDKNLLKNDKDTIYKAAYTNNKVESSLTLLIPEELIAIISDIIIGGTGKDSYKGALTELQLNATLNLLKTLFVNIASTFSKISEREIEFKAKPLFIDESNPEYNKTFEEFSYDFLVNYKLKLDSDNEFNIKLMLDSQELKQVISRIGGSNAHTDKQKYKFNNDAINIDTLSGIEIDLTAILGKTQIPIKYALELSKDSLIELDAFEGDNVKVMANGIEVAEAQIVAVGENFGLRIVKLLTPIERFWDNK